MKIYKYEIEQTDLFELALPKGAKILTVQSQNEKPFIWVLVNPDAEKEIRQFRLAGTGHELETLVYNLDYIGTYQLFNGSFVGHLFEVLPNEKIIGKSLANNLFGV